MSDRITYTLNFHKINSFKIFTGNLIHISSSDRILIFSFVFFFTSYMLFFIIIIINNFFEQSFYLKIYCANLILNMQISFPFLL